MSYRGDGAWDGGPPGAEADYASSRAPAMPSTDPWTGASYAQYPPNYDYSAYSANYAAYGYDQNYYQSQEYYRNNPGSYPAPGTDNRYNQPSQQGYGKTEKKRVYKHNSRTPSPASPKREAFTSANRSRDRSRKYSSSDRSSSSSSRDRIRKNKKHRSYSSDSTDSSSSSLKSKSSSRHSRSSDKEFCRTPEKAPRRRRSPHTPEGSPEKERLKGKEKKSHSSKNKTRAMRPSEDQTFKKVKTNKRKSISPRKSQSLTPPRAYKCKEKSESPPRKYGHRDSSITPPKSYMPQRTSRSSSREFNFSRKVGSRESSHSHTPPPRRSRSTSRPGKRKTVRSTKLRSRSRSGSSKRSTSKGNKKKHSPSVSSQSSEGRGKHSRSRSADRKSDSNSDSSERRGQFTVEDRKRFWKLHRKNRQEYDEKSPPKEAKPPPGAVETVALDDIKYGVPPEVEGPNFAELPLSSAGYSQASSSKGRGPLPIKNDGSFLEMFKRMQEVTKKVEEPKPEMKKPALPFIGKRRGGRVLKTGLVKKAKAIDEQPAETPKDAWSLYMQEVKKYRETSCEEERKTRPLVK